MSTKICTWLEDFLFSNLWFCLDSRQHFTVFYPGSELSMILLPWLPGEGVAGVGHFVQFDNLISLTVDPPCQVVLISPQNPCYTAYGLNSSNESP